MALTIGELVGYLRIDRKDWSSGIGLAQRQLDRLGAGVAAVGRSGGLLMLAAQGVQAAAAVAPVSGTLLAIPAAAMVAVFALGTVKIATAGVGDAMKAVAEGDARKMDQALTRLSPQARRFVLAWSGLAGAFRPIQQAAQDRFFAGLDRDVTALGRQALPGLRAGLLPAAGALNGLVREGVRAAGTPLFSGLLTRVGQSSASSLQLLRGAAEPLVGTIANAAKVGLPWVEHLLQLAAAALKVRLAFAASEAGAGRMSDAINRGIATAGRLASIAGHVSAAVGGIFRAARGDGAGDLLGTVDALAARLSAWINSTAGQSALHEWFARLGQVGSRVAEVVGQVLDVAGQLATVIAALPAPVQDAATSALAWSIVLGPIAGKLAAVGSAVLSVAGAVGTGVAAAYRYLFAQQAAAGGTRAAWLAAKVSTVGSWLAMQAAAMVSALRIGLVMGATATWAAAVWVAQLTAAAVATVARLVMMAASFAVQGAVMVASAAATAAAVVAGWVLMGVQSLVQATRMAAAWVIAMGPVGWVIAAIVGLVAVVVANWDAVKAWTERIWTWVWEKIRQVWDLIVAYVRFQVTTALAVIGWLASLPGKAGEWFGGVHRAIVARLGEAVAFVRELPGKVWDALGDAAGRAVQWGQDLVQGIINGIGDMVGRLVQKAKDAASAAMNAIKSTLGIGSPSRITTRYGHWVGEGLTLGIRGMIDQAARAGGDLARAALRSVPAGGPGSQPAGAGVAGPGGGIVVQNLNLRAFSDRFDLGQVQDELYYASVR